MSFSGDTKIEITQRRLSKPCCVLAAAYGAACFAKYFDERGIVVQTEQESVAQFLLRVYQRCGVQGTVISKERPSGILYEFSVKDPCEVQKLHALFGTTGKETNLQINPSLLRCSHCVSSYIAAAFLCGGTLTDPEKEYNLEFLTSRYNLSRDFEALLAEHEFVPHRTRRKGVYVIYVKASSNIEDLLTFIGATNASMKVMDQKVYRSMRNQVNRLNNCETANMQKRIDSNAAAQKAIRYLEEQGVLETLSAPLRQAAEIRKQMPEASLSELSAACNPPVSKSGLSHRLKKLVDLATQLYTRNQKKDETTAV